MIKKYSHNTKQKRTATKVVYRDRIARASYDSAQTTSNNSRYWSYTDALSADAEGRPDVRKTLRERCRYEVANNCYARGLVDIIANDLIGSGPRLQMMLDDESVNDNIEYDFAEWSRAVNLPKKLRLLRKERCQNGEAFVLIGTNPKLPVPVKLSIMTIEADRIEGEIIKTGDDIEVDGIKYDKYGNPVSYRILNYHPGDIIIGNTYDAEIVSSDYVVHEFTANRSGQHRGIPELTPALEQFAQLRRYGLAELSAAEAAADFAAILYTDQPADGESRDLLDYDSVPLERNMLTVAPAGWKIGQMDSKHPTSNYPQTVKVNLGEIARSVCATYGTISGDFSGFNYASGRLDAQIYQKSIIVDRTQWETDVLDPIFRKWIREWCLVNGVILPARHSHIWFWDGFMHVDPTKEANANNTNLSNYSTTLADVYAAKGQDVRVKLRQIARINDFAKKLNIPLPYGKNTSDTTSSQEDNDE